MSTIEERIHTGSRAREVLENEEFIAAFDAIEAEIIEKWKTAPIRDVEGREKLHQYLTMLKKVQAHLTQTLETGKLAMLDLEHKRTLQQRAKEGWQRFNES